MVVSFSLSDIYIYTAGTDWAWSLLPALAGPGPYYRHWSLLPALAAPGPYFWHWLGLVPTAGTGWAWSLLPALAGPGPYCI